MTKFIPKTEIPVSELLTVAQAVRRLPHLTESALRAKIREHLVRSIYIGGRLFLSEDDLKHTFGPQYRPPVHKK